MPDFDRKEIESRKWHKNDKGLFLPENYVEEKKPEKKNTIKAQLKWVFNNLTTALLLPSFLGAVWQILELSSINIAYIRFFSLSQIPIDGALILSLFIMLVGISKFIISFVKFIFNHRLEQFEDESFLRKVMPTLNRTLAIHATVSIGILIAMLFFLPMIFSEIFSKSPIATILIVAFCTLGTMLYLADALVLLIIKLYSQHASKKDAKIYVVSIVDKYKYHIYWSGILSIVIGAFVLVGLLKLFSQNFILPPDLYNTKNLESIIYDEFKTKDYSIEYFNDKYIFVKLCAIKDCKHMLDKEIVIYPTEKVLFKTTYGKVWTGYFTTYKPVEK